MISSHKQDLIATVKEGRDLMSNFVKLEAQVNCNWV